MSHLTPAEASALAADPEVVSQATDFAAAALLFCSGPRQFGRFRRSLMGMEAQQGDWLAQLEPDDLIAFAAALAPEGAS